MHHSGCIYCIVKCLQTLLIRSINLFLPFSSFLILKSFSWYISHNLRSAQFSFIILYVRYKIDFLVHFGEHCGHLLKWSTYHFRIHRFLTLSLLFCIKFVSIIVLILFSSPFFFIYCFSPTSGVPRKPIFYCHPTM